MLKAREQLKEAGFVSRGLDESSGSAAFVEVGLWARAVLPQVAEGQGTFRERRRCGSSRPNAACGAIGAGALGAALRWRRRPLTINLHRLSVWLRGGTVGNRQFGGRGGSVRWARRVHG